MKTKKGVDIRGCRQQMQAPDIVVKRVFDLIGLEPVITSGTDGRHGIGSYHSDGLAKDYRSYFWTFPKKRMVLAVAEIKRQLRCISPFYDIVLEKTHIHIEYDLRREQRMNGNF